MNKTSIKIEDYIDGIGRQIYTVPAEFG